MTLVEPRVKQGLSWGLIPALGVAASAVLIFALYNVPAGYAVLAASLIVAVIIDRDLASDLLLIGIGLGIISTISVAADISYSNMVLMGVVLTLAVVVPFVIDRYVYKRRTIVFPVKTGQKWSTLERSYLAIVLVLGWTILPLYFIRSGAYLNWPAINAPDEIGRLFVGVNAVGIWDELFFICTVFALLRRHLPDWQANALQAVLFTSFLWELGFHAWAPLFIAPFALVQALIFRATMSLSYIVCVHLLFDFVLFLVLVHAHNPHWIRIFVY